MTLATAFYNGPSEDDEDLDALEDEDFENRDDFSSEDDSNDDNDL